MEDAKEYFSQVYDEYIEPIYRFAYMKTGSAELAEDLASEVFTRCWQSYKAKRIAEEVEIENMRAFLYRIARNVIADHYRRGGSVQFFSLEQTAIEMEDMGDGPEEMARTRLELDRVRRAIVDLPQDYQDLVIWRYLEDLPVPEIAELTGKTENNVRVGLHRGLEMLKERLPVEEPAGELARLS